MRPTWQVTSQHASEQIGGFTPFRFSPGMDLVSLGHWLEQVQIAAHLAKRWRVDRHWNMPSRVLLGDWMMWVESGAVQMEIEGFSGSITKGAGWLMVVPAGLHHAARLHKSTSARLITVHFRAQLFGNLGFLDLMGMAGAYQPDRQSPVQDALLELCRETALDGVGRQRAMRGQIERILLYLLRNHGDSMRPNRRFDHYPYLARLQPILQLIDDNIDKSNLSVPELADVAAVSEVYLRRMFRRTLGISPAAYMQRRRVERAGHLLRTTQLTIKEIARQSGFHDPHFLMRIFRKWLRQTPTEFRKAKQV